MIVLDTHTWIWWVSDRGRLSVDAERAIADSDAVGVSAISAWEVAMLARHRRIELDRPVARWVRQALAADGRVVEVALTTTIAVAAVGLGDDGMHLDPADRFLLATAREHGGRLVTKDAAIRAFAPDDTVW